MSVKMIPIIEGEKGGKGGARDPVEAPNTLQSRQYVHVVDLISEGEIEGLATDSQADIFFDGTPLEGNFPGITTVLRTGVDNQSPIAQFYNPVTLFQVNVEILRDVITSRAVSDVDVDQVQMAMLFTEGLYKIDIPTGDINGWSVKFHLERRVEGGVWERVHSSGWFGKSMGPVEQPVWIGRPNTGADGFWEFRIIRAKADDSKATAKSMFTWTRYTELDFIKLGYDNTALIASQIPAESTGGVLAKRAFLVKGIKVEIPVNYDPVTRIYSGAWNGTFKTAYTNNPAWILYDLITNVRYGFGEFVTPELIDKFSFYDAGIYCDGNVPSGLATGETEPRFTFNGVIQTRQDPIKTIQAVASTMRAFVCNIGGLIKVVQDRPKTATAMVTNSAVNDGTFNYSSSDINQRHSEIRVTFSDPAQKYLPTTIVEINAEAQARYGSVPLDAALYGCTSEGQARRYGKWLLDTELHAVDVVAWTAGWESVNYTIGDIVKVVDNDYMNLQAGGRLKDGSTTTEVVLDRTVVLDQGKSYTLTIHLDDGTTETRSVANTNGSFSTVTTSAFSETPVFWHEWFISADVVPREFQVLRVREQEQHGIFEIEAVEHDASKFARIDFGLNVPAAPTFAPQQLEEIGPVQNVNARIESWSDPTGQLPPRHYIHVHWDKPIIGADFVSHYRVRHSHENQPWKSSLDNRELSLDIEDIKRGNYEIKIFPFSVAAVQGPPVTINVFVEGITVGPNEVPLLSGLDPLTLLTVRNANGGADTYFTKDLTFTWANSEANLSNAGPAILEGFHIRIYNATKTKILKETFIKDTSIGEHTFTFVENENSEGGPHRTVVVEMTAQDTYAKETVPIELAMSNPAPVAIGFDALVSDSATVFVELEEVVENDFAGYFIWRSTVNGFTPSVDNQVYKGLSTLVGLKVDPETTYYYKTAAFDLFSDDISTLNISGQVTDVSSTPLPANVDEYVFEGLFFTGNDPSTDKISWTSGVASISNQGAVQTYDIDAGDAPYTAGKLYIFYIKGQTILRHTTSLVTALSTDQRIIAVYQGGLEVDAIYGEAFIDGDTIFAGTVGANQLVTGSAIITGTAQIANAIITNAQMSTASIGQANIIDGSIVNAKIGTAEIDTLKIANGSISLIDAANYFGLDNAIIAEVGNVWSNSTIFKTVVPDVSLTGGATQAQVQIDGNFRAKRNTLHKLGWTYTNIHIEIYWRQKQTGGTWTTVVYDNYRLYQLPWQLMRNIYYQEPFALTYVGNVLPDSEQQIQVRIKQEGFLDEDQNSRMEWVRMYGLGFRSSIFLR